MENISDGSDAIKMLGMLCTTMAIASWNDACKCLEKLSVVVCNTICWRNGPGKVVLNLRGGRTEVGSYGTGMLN